MCKWFIGLAFNKVENQNVDLTFDIQSFTNIGNITFYIVIDSITNASY